MPNAIVHRAGAALVVGGFLLAHEGQQGKMSHEPFSGALASAICTNIPDWLEPAVHPHHRQFFHSVAFAGMVAYGMYRAHKWNPETDLDKFLRFCILAAGAGVLIHLAMDSLTSRSLPIIGK